MLECLEKHFVNAWILQKDLEALALDADADPELREAAGVAVQRTREHLLMPVGIQVLSPEGELLSSASVNRDGLMGHGSEKKYLRILEAGLPRQRRADW